MTINELAEATGRDRKTITRNKNLENTSRSAIIAMGIALGLTFEEMKRFLYLASYSLCPLNAVDYAYIQVIDKYDGYGVKRVKACNDALYEMGFRAKHLLGKFN